MNAPKQEGATVLDSGFLYANGIHTPTLLIAFAPNDWDARDKFASSLSAAPQSDGWRPIAEAPKDGSEIDVWLVTGREPDVFWGTPKLGHKVPCWCRHVYDSYFGWIPESVGEPTHFMNLPTPPKMTQTQGDE